jgi:hypothetical protein
VVDVDEVEIEVLHQRWIDAKVQLVEVVDEVVNLVLLMPLIDENEPDE